MSRYEGRSEKRMFGKQCFENVGKECLKKKIDNVVACAGKTREPESIALAVSHFSCVQVFQSMFEFLEENWSKLSPAVMKGLKDRPLVPVGARLIKAGRLFFRLKVSLVSLPLSVSPLLVMTACPR